MQYQRDPTGHASQDSLVDVPIFSGQSGSAIQFVDGRVHVELDDEDLETRSISLSNIIQFESPRSMNMRHPQTTGKKSA